MFVNFETLPENAVVWYFQSNRDLTETEQKEIVGSLSQKMDSWAAHGMPLKSSLKILMNRILIIAIDAEYQKATGCSTDVFSDWIIELNHQLNIDLFDRSIAYFEGENLHFFPIFQAKKYVLNGTIQPETKILNHQIKTIEELKSKHILLAKDSFLMQYFKLTEAK